MDERIRKYLFDVIESIDSIDSYLGNERSYKRTNRTRCFGVR
jgi:hypothetical protein